MGICPALFHAGQHLKLGILDDEEASLLQVGQRHPPATLEVGERPQFKDFSHRPRRGARIEPIRCSKEILRIEVKRSEQLGANVQEIESVLCALQCAVLGTTQLYHLDEVVQVACLERGILSIVNEGEELASARVELVLWQILQRRDDRRREHRHRAAATLPVKGGQLRVLRSADRFVGNAASQTEAERTRNPGGERLPLCRFSPGQCSDHPVRSNPDSRRYVSGTGLGDRYTGRPLSQPRSGKTPGSNRVLRPGKRIR